MKIAAFLNGLFNFTPISYLKYTLLTLIKSISGTRGTIGGLAGDNLTPQDIVSITAAFGAWLLHQQQSPKIVIGRDGRISGSMVSGLVTQTLVGMGIDVLDLGISTTPTVEMAVPMTGAGAGIIITASHNPKEWNALKFLNQKGEFISAEDGAKLLDIEANSKIEYASVDQLGSYQVDGSYLERHLEAIMAHPLVQRDNIAEREFHIVIDPVNSSGAIAIPLLLEHLGCTYSLIHAKPNGHFERVAEPLPQHLDLLGMAVREEKAELGIAVDPDVDRLAFVCEDGQVFGEEYTLVAVADYVMSKKPGPCVSNLSSSRALRDVADRYDQPYYASAVGEVNVVQKMKEVGAVIGGEGNGGVIVPDLHYGRDALIGIALFLSHLAERQERMSTLRTSYPHYDMVKEKIQLTPGIDVDALLESLKEKYREQELNTADGVKIDFPDRWVHLRKSNTEPIIRVYAEAPTPEGAKTLVDQLKTDVAALM